LNKNGLLTATASPAQPRRPEILRLATATAYELYGGLRRLTAAARGSICRIQTTVSLTLSAVFCRLYSDKWQLCTMQLWG